jgi:hypothetical protein
VLHGFTEYPDRIPLKDALWLMLLYTGASFVLTGLFRIFFHDLIKASLAAFFVMAFHFFFGSVQDLVKNNFPGAFISRYSFILPFSFLLFIIMIVWLKKRKKPFPKIISYLNILLLIFSAIDLVRLVDKMLRVQEDIHIALSKEGLHPCDTCNKPDIYFIILDEYTGNTSLKVQFDFDNISFETALIQKGFHVVKESQSNYNSTPYSVASTLNMNYLHLDMKTENAGNLNNCYQSIADNLVLKFLKAEGYRFFNYSIFDFPHHPAINHDSFLPANTRFITSQTFPGRMGKEIRFNIINGKWKCRPLLKKFTAGHHQNNENFLRLTKNITIRRNSSPKFIYTHLMMPHSPYYFDSKGNPAPLEKLVEGHAGKEKDYVEYLQYCNKKILEMAEYILASSPDPPLIMLLGDHGGRRFKNPVADKYYFLNLNAVYLPGENYSGFYDGMSSVNLFRVLFNQQFLQQMPLLKDSTVYLWR